MDYDYICWVQKGHAAAWPGGFAFFHWVSGQGDADATRGWDVCPFHSGSRIAKGLLIRSYKSYSSEEQQVDAKNMEEKTNINIAKQDSWNEWYQVSVWGPRWSKPTRSVQLGMTLPEANGYPKSQTEAPIPKRERDCQPGPSCASVRAEGVSPNPKTPQPSTLNPQPSTLNPQPSTLNPQP